MDNEKKTKEYKDTLNLPRTDFPMKANLPQREPAMLSGWEKRGIYGAICAKRRTSAKTFMLHDGPPYANGHIHMGHVLNKLLKDICIKYYSMKGYYAPYVPGWDCHGLPVEHQLFKELGMTKHQIGQVEFRKKAYKYAMKYVGIQRDEFKRIGVFADWKEPYLTLTREYEADILFALADLAEKGYIYKDLKPVNWCSSCETALAEAEVEYEDKVSPSIYVKFPAASDEQRKTFFIIWTTTPWTLIANAAVALHPEHKYAFVDAGGETWILASELVESLMKKLKKTNYKVVSEVIGKELLTAVKKARHPFLDRDSVLVTAEYVTMEDGTGCVHTAPGHGQDDYVTGKKFGLPVIMPVDQAGRFNREAGEFAGRHVYEADPLIIDKMKANGSLVLSEDTKHSYPHCWRCKQPIIFRATEQWFMNVDHEGLRRKIEDAIEKRVRWIPASGKERIGSMMRSRPDWCLSRQRYWGVPIPAVQCVECGEAVTNPGIIRKVAELTRTGGADVWFERDVNEFIPGDLKCAKCGSRSFRKENDILDVWFDSGVSHRAVLKARDDLSFPADLYLEGSDQHRGWFQAALITSMGINGIPPYRQVLTHGFVVDGEGKKMSKSMGNVISPEEIMKKYGADILRLWVASSDYEGDIKLSTEILDRLADGYRKIRNTFRYILSNLYDFDPATDQVDRKDMPETDRWMLSRLSGLAEDIDRYYSEWEFHRVYRSAYDFCVCEVSSFYLDVLKDILYILSPDSVERRSAQTVLYRILDTLTRLLAPILSFTTDEVWGYVPVRDKEESVHLADWPKHGTGNAAWKDDSLDAKWARILRLRDDVMKVLEARREEGLIGSSLEACLVLYPVKEDARELLRTSLGLLPALFKVSQAVVSDEGEDGMADSSDGSIRIGVKRAAGKKCPRCWNYSDTVGKDGREPALCGRCAKVISERRNNGK
ncbi:MAG: isoleucine--tRNA ligase [Candidatus Omnitrophica bacterium]|nr:isoleucine--tRNA ligase [Candidatus Omnitrophota bacterium]